MRQVIALILLGVGSVSAASELPEGRAGLAARYPGDVRIETDPKVILVEPFDADLETIFGRWDNVKGQEICSLSEDAAPGSADSRSLLMRHVGGEGTGGHLYTRLGKDYDQVFARFYVKFDPECAPVHHFGTNLGGNNPATRWPMVSAGNRPAGDKQFWTGVEPYGAKWEWDFYTYWQGMHRHGDGRFWGTPFLVGAEKPAVERGRWICVEMMVKINEPASASNGEQAFWIDGRLVRDGGQVVSHIGPGFPRGRWTGGWWRPDADAENTFEGFAWRSVEDYAVNYVWAYLYITGAEKGHVSRVWFDNIVVATEYIGPIEPRGSGSD